MQKSKYFFIQDRMRELGKKQIDLARLLGIAGQQLSITLHRPFLREFQVSEIAKVADFLNYNVSDFAAYVGGDTNIVIRDAGNMVENSVKIPYMNVAASAGDGIYTDTEYVQSFLRVSLGKFANKLGKVQNINAIAVAGDSMTPTLRDGDIILVDVADTEISDGKIYIIAINNQLFVKRLFKNPVTKKITIKSDNPLHPVWDAGEDELHVCGRLVMRAFERL